jgi:hypothetical protein
MHLKINFKNRTWTAINDAGEDVCAGHTSMDEISLHVCDCDASRWKLLNTTLQSKNIDNITVNEIVDFVVEKALERIKNERS